MKVTNELLNVLNRSENPYLIGLPTCASDTYGLLDISKTDGYMISYIRVDNNPDATITDDHLRIRTKIGRFLKRIYDDMSDREVELAANAWIRSCMILEVEQGKKPSGFKVCKGKDIFDLYQMGSTNSNVSACMNGKPRHYFHLYEDATDVLKMVYRIRNGKLSGRALVWKSADGRMWMDRIYSEDEETRLLFRQYAAYKGWNCKKYDSYDKFSYWIAPDGVPFEDKTVVIKLKFDPNFVGFPFLDTFCYMRRGSNELRNYPYDENGDRLSKRQTTDGGSYGHYNGIYGRLSDMYETPIGRRFISDLVKLNSDKFEYTTPDRVRILGSKKYDKSEVGLYKVKGRDKLVYLSDKYTVDRANNICKETDIVKTCWGSFSRWHCEYNTTHSMYVPNDYTMTANSLTRRTRKAKPQLVTT